MSRRRTRTVEQQLTAHQIALRCLSGAAFGMAVLLVARLLGAPL